MLHQTNIKPPTSCIHYLLSMFSGLIGLLENAFTLR